MEEEVNAAFRDALQCSFPSETAGVLCHTLGVERAKAAERDKKARGESGRGRESRERSPAP